MKPQNKIEFLTFNRGTVRIYETDEDDEILSNTGKSFKFGGIPELPGTLAEHFSPDTFQNLCKNIVLGRFNILEALSPKYKIRKSFRCSDKTEMLIPFQKPAHFPEIAVR